MDEIESESARQKRLKTKLTHFLRTNYQNIYFNGDPESGLPGLLNFSFHGLEGETIRLLLLLDDQGIAVSAGSACSSNNKGNNASHVLQAIGRNPFEARGAVRVSMGRFTQENDIARFSKALEKTVASLTTIFSNQT